MAESRKPKAESRKLKAESNWSSSADATAKGIGAFSGPHAPTVIVHSWPCVEAVHGFEMAGILGHNFLRRYRVTIDFSADSAG